MNPIYLDLHIHTSNNPNKLNEHYDLDNLIKKVREEAKGDDFLISFTDHNTINEKVYLEAVEKIPINLILGVELHIQTHKGSKTKAYHCHIYFDLKGKKITSKVIMDINAKLHELYPDKAPRLDNPSIPDIQSIIECFDEYEFILLPHGGQTHATFDVAMPKGKEFDNTMQRSIYYNFFDGFTSRSDKGTSKTRAYLERLGVQEFVNLITCTDNYQPSLYPKPKSQEAQAFIPTWMFATPTFEGLRLSLSDGSRLQCSHQKPKEWRESIKKIYLKNDKIDIDAELTPGLNVIIGESSSGKTLFVDSLYRKLTNSSFEDSLYNEFSVEQIEVNYPDKSEPHFIYQNFIVNITQGDKEVNSLPIIAKLLPGNSEERKIIDKGLGNLKDHLNSLFDAVEQIETLEIEIRKIPTLSSLIISEKVDENILRLFLNALNSVRDVGYSNYNRDEDSKLLKSLDAKLTANPFIKHNKNLIKELEEEVQEMRDYSILEEKVRKIAENKKEEIDRELKERKGESQRRKQYFELLINKMKDYYIQLERFDQALKKIAEYSIEAKTNKVIIEGCLLSVENKFELNKDILKQEFNKVLLKSRGLVTLDNISAENLFKGNFVSTLKGHNKGNGATYKLIKENIYMSFAENDQIHYKIETSDGKDFDNLSPGLKTSIILELILNFEGDSAPLIIDQPEDNLATSYMNEGLVRSIKKMKNKKQIIFVSHNATIPMAGDAQNIILCENRGGKIIIRSSPLEGKIDGVPSVDYIAKIADGGKASIKKRFKKYNLKKFKE